MIRLAAVALLLVAPQDAIEAEAKFRAALDRIERAGLTVPDLPAGAAELDALLTKSIPKALRDRYLVVRSQALVLAAVHGILVKARGTQHDIPVPPGKPVKVTVVEVVKRGVKIVRGEGTQEIAWSELDAEWMLATARPDLSAVQDATLLSGLWLAKAARWDAAFLALGEVETDHPLALEARKRGLDAAMTTFEAIVRGKRWTEALAKLDSLEKLAPGDARLVAARDKILDGMVEQGKELCRKGSKGAMKDLIDLITKHFPDGAERIEDIREANRWVKITDPKKLGLDTPKGPPWLLEPKDGKEAFTAYFRESADKVAGLAVVVRLPKGEETMAGITFDNRRRIVSISGKESIVGAYFGNTGEMLQNITDRKIKLEDRHHLSVRLRGKEFVMQYNGEELYRSDGNDGGFDVMGLNAHKGKAWFDEVWVLKKE